MDLIPDAERVVIAWLLTLTGITSVVGNRVASAIDRTPTWPLGRVTRTGGTVDIPWRDVPRVQIEWWGDISQTGSPDAASHDLVSSLAQTTVSSIDTFHGVYAGGFVHSQYVSLGPIPSSDPTTFRPRQIVEVTFDLEKAP